MSGAREISHSGARGIGTGDARVGVTSPSDERNKTDTWYNVLAAAAEVGEGPVHYGVGARERVPMATGCVPEGTVGGLGPFSPPSGSPSSGNASGVACHWSETAGGRAPRLSELASSCRDSTSPPSDVLGARGVRELNTGRRPQGLTTRDGGLGEQETVIKGEHDNTLKMGSRGRESQFA
ncbi:hypothetical protein Emed_004663 [Eimeria media]